MDGLPIFSFRPNWADGMSESLVFVSDVLASDTGNEQRRSLRLSPGRSFELSLLLKKEERTFFDLSLNNHGAGEWAVPLWHDIGRLAAPVVLGADRLDFDTRWREFQVGGYALIQGPDAFTFEEVEIADMDDDGLDLVDPLARGWAKGSPVMPLRRGRLDLENENGFSRYTSAVAESNIRFNVIEPNDWTPAADDSAMYAGVPIFNLPPNYSENLDFSFLRNMAVLGNDFGKSFYADRSGRAFAAQGHSWYLKGRQAQAGFRDLIYRNKGRVGSFWLPTFSDDMTLVATAGAVATTFTIRKIGYGLSGGPQPGREYVLIELNNGNVIAGKVVAVLAGLTPENERVQLQAALGTEITPATVRRISFMDRARFDSDQFDLQHHTDTDGLTTVSTAFRTFRGDRDASGAIYVPIPASVMTDEECGEPTRPTCGPVVCPAFRSLGMVVPGCNPAYWPTTNLYIPDFGPPGFGNVANPPIVPGGPSGIGLVFNQWLGNPQTGVGAEQYAEGFIYESNAYNDPEDENYQNPDAIRLQGQLLVEWTKTPLTFYIKWHFALGGPLTLDIQYGAFFCGSVGEDATNMTFTDCVGGELDGECVVDCTPIVMCPELPCIVGNVAYHFEGL